MEPHTAAISEAPSPADLATAEVVAGEARVGTVDFSTRLGDRADRAEGAEDERPGTDARAFMVRPTRPEDDDTSLPFILPPAKVDAAMVAETERTRQEVAVARGESDDAEDDLDDEQDDAAEEPDTAEATDTDTESDDARDEAATREGPALLIHDVADLEHVAVIEQARAAEREAELTAVRETELAAAREAAAAAAAREAAELEATQRAAAVAAAELEAEEAALARARARAEEEARSSEASKDPDDVGWVDDDAVPTPAQTVAEVADSVVAAIQELNRAYEEHVEALELRAARRCELLTAQAELDAELIRLHARREAHAIIAAARHRVADPDLDELDDDDQLGQIGQTFSRFAQTIETTVIDDESPDHPRMP